MAKEFDNLENEALRYGAGVPADTKFRNLTAEQRQGFDSYMKTKIRRDPSVYANDSRAKKYLKDYDQSTFDAMRQQEIRDSVNPGAMWDDFAGAGAGSLTFDDGNDGYNPDQSEATRAREEQRDDLRDESEPEEKKPETGEPSDTPTEPGTDAAAEGASPNTAKAAKGLGDTAKVAEGAESLGSVGASGAGLANAAAGATGAGAAAETAAAGTAVAGPGLVLNIILLLGVVGITLAVLTSFGFKFGGVATALPTNSPTAPSSGGASGLMAKACYFKDNPTEYKKVKANGWTDCWGFVATSLRYGADSDFRYAPRAKDGPDLLEAHDKAKHSNKKYVVLPYSTRSLKPGDMLFVTNSGSHAGLYIGKNYCACGTKTTLQASLNTQNFEIARPPSAHGPKCDNLANRWDTIVRIVN